jgi:hypothetical protein
MVRIFPFLKIVSNFPSFLKSYGLIDIPYYQKGNRQVKTLISLAHLHFEESFFCFQPSLWPGSPAFGGIARKKHRRAKNSIRRSCLASAGWGGPIGRPAGRPYIGKPLFSEKERPARPEPC